MEYPHFRQHLSNGNRIEFFSLTSDERFLLSQWRTDTNILGFAILLKSYQYLGYPPKIKEEIPDSVISFVSQQLKLDAALFDQYRWKDSVWRVHLTSIRDHNKFQPGSKENFQRLGQWLIEEADCHPTRSKMYTAAIKKCRSLRIELPSEKELQRLVSSTWKQYLNQACQTIADRIVPSIRDKMDLCLDVDPQDKERFGWMKAKPGKIGIKTLTREISRLRFVIGFEIQKDSHLADVRCGTDSCNITQDQGNTGNITLFDSNVPKAIIRFFSKDINRIQPFQWAGQEQTNRSFRNRCRAPIGIDFRFPVVSLCN